MAGCDFRTGATTPARKLGEGTHERKDGTARIHWDPCPSPLRAFAEWFFLAKEFPDWRGDILVGSLKFNYIARLKGIPLA